MSAPNNDTFTHTTKTRDGDLRISEVHGRIHETFRRFDSRIPVTAAMEADAAVQHFRRGYEIATLLKAKLASRDGSA